VLQQSGHLIAWPHEHSVGALTSSAGGERGRERERERARERGRSRRSGVVGGGGGNWGGSDGDVVERGSGVGDFRGSGGSGADVDSLAVMHELQGALAKRRRSRDVGEDEELTAWGRAGESLRALQCVAVCCSVLQCVAVCCSVLQCVAVWCSVMQLLCAEVQCEILEL